MSITPLDRARRLALAASAAVSVALCCGAFATSASALTQVTCNGLNAVTYSPPLTNTLKTTTINSQTSFGTCVSLTHPGIVSGTVANGTTTGPSSCTAVLGNFSAVNVITWNTGQTSTFTFNGYVNEVDGQFVIVLTGSITSGLFAGATATEQTTLLGDLSSCAGAGIAYNSGPAALTIVGL